jgi:hypothetical protein
VSSTIYLEGGGNAKDLHVRCRKGFRKLLKQCDGFAGRMPKLVACGSRNSAFDDFATAHARSRPGDFVAMWIDSEDPMERHERTWEHLRTRDGWTKPRGAVDDQVLMMTTCMETWIVADRESLKQHYEHDGANRQESALPPLDNLESRSRDEIQDKLVHATRKCPNAYEKGKRSFNVLAVLTPERLKPLLPSFRRVVDVLNKKLA